MNTTELSKQLQQIQNTEANLIVGYMDELTGEIPEGIFQHLDKLGVKKEIIVNSAIVSYNEFNDLISYIDAKLERLTKIKKVYSRTSSSIKSILQKNIPEGENIHSDEYQIGWRKSEIVEIDEFASLRDIEEKHPNCVKTTKTFNKTELKKLLKEGVKIDSVKLTKKNNIQIK